MTAFAMYALVYWGCVFMFGSIWGSFFYTLALRFSEPRYNNRMLRILFAPSHCPRCEVKISLPGLIPYLGYLIQRGQCGNCRSKISFLYPFSEFLFGILCCVLVYSRGIGIDTLLLFIFLGIAAAVSLIDIRTMIIPNQLVLALLAIALTAVLRNNDVKDHLYAALGMFSFFVIILLVFPGSFGGGDVKFAAVIGFLMGIRHSIVVMEIALITGSLIGITYVLLKKSTFRIKIPFAPFLFIGLVGAVLYGKELIFFYNTVFF